MGCGYCEPAQQRRMSEHWVLDYSAEMGLYKLSFVLLPMLFLGPTVDEPKISVTSPQVIPQSLTYACSKALAIH